MEKSRATASRKQVEDSLAMALAPVVRSDHEANLLVVLWMTMEDGVFKL